jgi:uncharacterized protein YggT (Ycf19 family)
LAKTQALLLKANQDPKEKVPRHAMVIAFWPENAQGPAYGRRKPQRAHMGLIDFILNLAGVLLWLNWRSIRFDPLVKTRPATLIGTLRRAEPRQMKGWQLLAGLGALLVLRAVLYWKIGPEADWTPKLDLFVIVLAFPRRLLPGHFLPALVFSLLSFARMLIIGYFWLLALVVINRRSAEPDPLHKMLRLHLGPIARWPMLLQVILPLVLITALWIAIHPLLAHLGITSRVHSNANLAEQGLLIGVALYLTLQFLLPVFLLLHLFASYIYLGRNPLWDFIGATARNLLVPLRWLPLRIGRLDFAPLGGVVLILFLLHWLPNLVLGHMAGNSQTLWPQ